MKQYLSILVLSLGLLSGGLAQDTPAATPAPPVQLSAQAVEAAGFGSLTASQKATLIKNVADQAAQTAAAAEKAANDAKTASVTSAEKVEQWVDIGTKVGKGLSGAAKEAGVAVNDFAKTPVGMLTTAIIVYKMIGKDAAGMFYHFLGGLLIWGIGYVVTTRAMKLAHTRYDYDKDGKLMHTRVEPFCSEALVTSTIVYIVTFIAGIIAIFSY